MGGWMPSLFGHLLGSDPDGSLTYRWSLGVLVLTWVLGTIAIHAMRGNFVAERTSKKKSRFFRFERPRVVAKVVVPHFLLGAGLGLTLPFTSIFFRNHLGASTGIVGTTMALFWVAGALGGLISPAVINRVGKVRAATGWYLLGMFALLGIGCLPTLWLASGSLWIRGIAASAASAAMTNFVVELVKAEERGRLNAMIQFFWSIGWAIASLSAGWIMTHWSYSLPYLFAALKIGRASCRERV